MNHVVTLVIVDTTYKDLMVGTSELYCTGETGLISSFSSDVSTKRYLVRF